jgi:Putative restriction endonuclease
MQWSCLVAPKGDPCGICEAARGSYQQWQEGSIAPQVVFEILSPSNTRREMNRKLLFYHTYGVEEYYLYNPDRNQLRGWCRSEEDLLDEIETMAGWVSPRLGIRFELAAELQLYRPDGTPFFSFAEINQMLDEERHRAEQERHRAEQAEQRAEQERQRAEQAEQRSHQLAEHLRSLGIDPDTL